MERHAVPQNIMDVEFKLFGALTIKQFGYLAGGFVFAFFFYLSGLPPLLTLVMIILSVVFGLFLSLVKINGQASSVWMSNFILAIFTSQQRVWRKTAVTPEILKDSQQAVMPEDVEMIKQTSRAIDRANRMPLENLNLEPQNPEVDKQENQRLDQIEQHFDFAMQDLEKQNQANLPQRQVVMPKSPEPVDLEVIHPRPKTVILKPEQDNLAGDISERPLIGEPVLNAGQTAGMLTPMGTVAVNRPVGGSKQEAETPVAKPKEGTVQSRSISAEKKDVATDGAAQTQQHLLAFRKPNIISGLVVDKSGKPVENAIVSIKDLKERLLRKVNVMKNGTFTLATPLPDATYHIDIEAPAFKFDRFQLILNGEVQPGYKFKAK